jgi:ActR/RegA family two-component response regulator
MPQPTREALVVNTDAASQKKARRALEMTDFRVRIRTARSESDALALAAEARLAPIELVMVDMTKTASTRLVQVLVESNVLHQQIVALLSSDAAPPPEISPGTFDVIRKPIAVWEVEHCIARFDQLSQQRKSSAPPNSQRTSLRVMKALHGAGGRLDAQKIADYLDVQLTLLATALGKNYTTVHKSPAAAGLQAPLAPIARSIELLREVFRDDEAVRAWLNSPHPDLERRTPWAVIQDGGAAVVEAMLESTAMGFPT